MHRQNLQRYMKYPLSIVFDQQPRSCLLVLPYQKWLNVGSFHSPYSEGLVNREEEPWGNAPLMWPAIDHNSGNSRAQAFWMGATNFTDENGTTYPHKIAQTLRVQLLM